ncbi:hypothetical protein Scep_014187 [Stephania cephalantha]|uniref:Uncharacterized protein n=1 Tax=Stephania cephalantha TaxID=152367 RepID=A0AAP0J3B8_9MAGN
MMATAVEEVVVVTTTISGGGGEGAEGELRQTGERTRDDVIWPERGGDGLKEKERLLMTIGGEGGEGVDGGAERSKNEQRASNLAPTVPRRGEELQPSKPNLGIIGFRLEDAQRSVSQGRDQNSLEYKVDTYERSHAHLQRGFGLHHPRPLLRSSLDLFNERT